MSVQPRSARRDAGLTLIELMLVLALASVVVLAATQIHSTISSQLEKGSRISDAQQTLRAAMEVIERYVRLSGRQLSVGVVSARQGGVEAPFPVILWTDGGATAPDQISMLFATDVSIPLNAAGYSPTATTITGDATQVKNGDLLAIDYYDTTQAPPVRMVCLKQATTTPGTSKVVDHGGTSTLNSPAGSDTCASKVTSSAQPVTMRLVGRGGVSFRINSTDDPRVPYLEMDPDGPLLGAGNGGFGFQRLAANVEDLQFAFQLSNLPTDPFPNLAAANEGWVNSGTLSMTDVQRIRNVRITLVVRVPQEQDAMTANNVAKGERPAVENRQASTASGGTPDGYVRRRMESIVQVRNFGMGL